MIKIGLHNIEKIIFNNEEIKSKLLHHKEIFDSWKFSKIFAHFEGLRTRSFIKLIHSISDADIKQISEILKDEVEFLTLYLNEWTHGQAECENLEFSLPLNKNIYDIAITRYDEQVKFTSYSGDFHV